jgi:hypothetical protein
MRIAVYLDQQSIILFGAVDHVPGIGLGGIHSMDAQGYLEGIIAARNATGSPLRTMGTPPSSISLRRCNEPIKGRLTHSRVASI